MDCSSGTKAQTKKQLIENTPSSPKRKPKLIGLVDGKEFVNKLSNAFLDVKMIQRSNRYASKDAVITEGLIELSETFLKICFWEKK